MSPGSPSRPVAVPPVTWLSPDLGRWLRINHTTDQTTRANYALLAVQEHLGDSADGLDVSWAEFVGNHRSSEFEFTVPQGPVTDPYLELQVFDVSAYDHGILVNGDALTGFDIPSGAGWQFWMDPITGANLVEGTNTLRFARDASTGDDFVIGTVTIHWREPVE